MPTGTFRLPALDLTIETTDGPRTWDGIVYAPLDAADSAGPGKVVFVAVGSPARANVPEWVPEALRAGTAIATLVGYPRQTWAARARLAEGEERAAAWAETKQART